MGGDGCWITKRLTMECIERVSRMRILRDYLGYQMRPLLILDWHVRIFATQI